MGATWSCAFTGITIVVLGASGLSAQGQLSGPDSRLPSAVARSSGQWLEAVGPYLGQEPPGDTPVVFGPGLVSTSLVEHGAITFSKAGDRVYWSVLFDTPGQGAILTSRSTGGRWSSPEVASFSTPQTRDLNPFLSPDGARLYFFSHRPQEAAREPVFGIWWVDLEDARRPARAVPSPVGSGTAEGGASVSADGTLYFWSIRQGGLGEGDIYRSRLVEGRFGEPENLGAAVNSPAMDDCTYVAPDGSYLVFDSDRPGGSGSWDLYLSFRLPDGSWSEARNLGEVVNSSGSEWFASVSPDGRYLFFVSDRGGNDDYYWVRTSVIERLRPDTGKR